MQIVIVGNPIEGFNVIGPFVDGEEAANWAEKEGHAEWWLAQMETPKNSNE